MEEVIIANFFNNMSSKLNRAVKSYEDFVVRQPSMATRLESVLKIASYIIPGRFGSGHQLAEIGYCVSNLYTLLNDYIISKRCHSTSSINALPSSQQRLLWILALIESTEVVVELGGAAIYREVGKWMAVLWMRLLKAFIQCIVVFKYQSRILTSPAVPAVDRKKAHPLPPHTELPPDGQPVAYVGTRTGKVIRSVHADSGIPYTELPSYINNGGVANSSNRREVHLSPEQVLAEGFHIARPLVHLASMVVFQQSSWKPWLISLAMDVLSLHLHGGLIRFKTSQPYEVLRRRMVLLLYLLRSPFYEKHTKSILFAFLHYIGTHVPLTSWIIEPLTDYLPVWQEIYSYNWMS